MFQMQDKVEHLESQLRQSTERLDLLTMEKEQVSAGLPSLRPQSHSASACCCWASLPSSSSSSSSPLYCGNPSGLWNIPQLEC